MDYRKGICGDCSAEYKLSPTFAADKAKCKKCGGIVAVGPVQSHADPVPPPESHTGGSQGSSSAPKPRPVPAKSPKPTNSPRQTPPKKVLEAPEETPRKKREGPSMKEKLLARRQAEQEATGTDEAKAQTARPAARSTRPKSASSRKASSSKSGSAGGSTRRSTGPKKSARSSTGKRDADEERGSSRPGHRGGRKKQNMPPALVIGSLLALVLATAGFLYKINSEDDTPENNEETVATSDGTQDTDTGENTPQTDAAGDSSAGTEGTADGTAEGDSGDDTNANPAGEEASPEQPTEATAPKEPSPPATETSEIPRNPVTGRFKVWMVSRQPKGGTRYPDEIYDPKDPAEPKLADFEPFSVPPGVDESEWLDIMDLARVMIDPDAGAAGTRAAIALEKKGKVAFPAIINVMLNLDFADPEGNMAGDVCQRSLQNIANGRNVGWYHEYRQEPNKTAIQNARCVELLYEKVWGRELKEPGYFERYAKIDEMKKRDDAPSEEKGGDALDDELDALDDF
ncbi:MAG: hypothetical protein CMJ86_02695 [Planctomycetes bacterium]|nr:hypothetical protein [Planctomycetota bacterium]